MAKYQTKEFEEKWQKKWEEEEVYKTPNNQSPITNNKKYVLAMFPYPSGAGLHVGHVRIYTGTDVLARFFRMQGYPVLHPMGWDAFGLPAENTALKAKKNPMDLVPKNIENFKRQMKMLGLSYDWEKEFSTTDPSYYKWTQWLFVQFFKMGLLYKKQMPIYYCPSCKTGLAEEEVLPNNTHERCGNEVERRTLPQWVFRITKYADRLLKDLDGLDWPSGILEMQRNWIGKSEGTKIKFKIKNSNLKIEEEKTIEVFTTRADTLYGVSVLVVAPEHWLIDEILSQKSKVKSQKLEEIKKYVEEAKKKMDLARTDLTKEKTGVDTGVKAIHPLTGEEIPIWVADYVLGWYGEGAVMVVPAHDERDFEFAKKFGLSIKEVVIDNSKLKTQKLKVKVKSKKFLKKAFTEYGILVNSGEFSGLTSKDAIKKITEKLEKLGVGEKAVTYKLRDWIFSRQRYWGEPIPMVYCEKCAKKGITYWDKMNDSDLKFKNKNLAGWFPIEEKDLPLKLPYVSSYEPTETGESPLSKIESFVKTTCPNCGAEAKRETDTMPNWAGSCWYFLAFPLWEKDNENQNFVISRLSSKNNLSHKQFLSQISTQRKNFDLLFKEYGKWLPVDWYLGGAEHAVLHLLYSRFWVKALSDLGLLNFKEPFLRLRNVGMVLAEDHRKMSKSLGNTVNPDEVVQEYGADALRLYEMFMAPFNQEIAWSTKALQGCYRFLKRVWDIYQKAYGQSGGRISEFEEPSGKTSEVNLVAKLNKTIKKVTDDISQIKFNTAIAAMMEFVNEWEKTLKVKRSTLSVNNAKKFLQILAPFAPFLTEEIWREFFGEKKSIHLSSWPKAEVFEDEEVVIPIQVNGKLRGMIKIQTSNLKSQNEIEKLALKEEKIKKYLEGKKYRFIYIEGKVGNFVVEVN